MKYLTIVLMLLAFEAPAFDSSAWMKRRQQFTRDAAALRAVYSNVVAQISQPAENVFVPIDQLPNGTVKTSIAARQAQFFLKEDLVWGRGVVVRQCDETGAETMRIESTNFLFDRKAKRGWSEGLTRVTRGKTVFVGENIFFSADDEYVLSLKSSSLDSKDLKIGGAL